MKSRDKYYEILEKGEITSYKEESGKNSRNRDNWLFLGKNGNYLDMYRRWKDIFLEKQNMSKDMKKESMWADRWLCSPELRRRQ